MKSQQIFQYQSDIKNNKIKQGFLLKRSRHLKQWKQRWMVLTKTHLYSFQQKQIYKNPTQKIRLKQVSTIKSYYKGQYSRPQVLRIQSNDTDFYLSCNNHQQKWAWITAIQKMTFRQLNLYTNNNNNNDNNNNNNDMHNMIRQTLRMSTAIRRTTVWRKSTNMIVEKNQKNNTKQNDKYMQKDMIKKIKLKIQMNVLKQTYIPQQIQKKQNINIQNINIQMSTQIQQYNNIINQLNLKIKQITAQNQKLNLKILQNFHNKTQIKQKPIQKTVQKIVQKIVYVPQIKQKILYVPQIKQKIIYVPQIKQVIKTVYLPSKQSESEQSNQHKLTTHLYQQSFNKLIHIDHSFSQSQLQSLMQFFSSILQLRCQVIYLLI